MSETVTAPENHQPRYEKSDVSVGALFGFAIGVVALVVFGVLISAGVFGLLVRVESTGPAATPFETGRELPPQPRLQTAAPQDLKHYKDAQNKTLSTYGWVDANGGVVRIPIDRAMDLMLQKGYPIRGTAAANGQMNTPGEAPPPPEQQYAPYPAGGQGVQ
jgi:hypothetical protein